jgi:CheY-like chemotaxis protein
MWREDGAPEKRGGGGRRTPTPPTPRSDDLSVLAGAPVLIVEDDASNAKLLSVVMRRCGCEVRAAETAEGALGVLQDFHPRVIILDLILPRMSGLVFAQMVKTGASTSDIVIVAVTSFNGPDAERLALDAGCALYVRKPIDPIAFPGLVAAVLRDAR